MATTPTPVAISPHNLADIIHVPASKSDSERHACLPNKRHAAEAASATKPTVRTCFMMVGVLTREKLSLPLIDIYVI